jgi:hypothetical protein
MSRATDSLLDQLHGAQAENLLAELKRFKESGEGIPASLFTAINKFLKDNGIDRAIIPGDPTAILDEELPEFDEFGNVVQGNF